MDSERGSSLTRLGGKGHCVIHCMGDRVRTVREPPLSFLHGLSEEPGRGWIQAWSHTWSTLSV